MNGIQSGNAVKAAQAIDVALQSDTPPLRLAIGHDPDDAIRDRSESLLAKLACWEPVARSLAFPGAEQPAA